MTRTRVMTQYGWELDMDFGMIVLLIVIVGVLWVVDQGDRARHSLEQFQKAKRKRNKTGHDMRVGNEADTHDH